MGVEEGKGGREKIQTEEPLNTRAKEQGEDGGALVGETFPDKGEEGNLG